VSWSDVPEADRQEQDQDVDWIDDDVYRDVTGGAPADIPLEAPADDVMQQRQEVPGGAEDERR
jgi:hypothetical protein